MMFTIYTVTLNWLFMRQFYSALETYLLVSVYIDVDGVTNNISSYTIKFIGIDYELLWITISQGREDIKKGMFLKFKYVYKKGWIKYVVLECLEKNWFTLFPNKTFKILL